MSPERLSSAANRVKQGAAARLRSLPWLRDAKPMALFAVVVVVVCVVAATAVVVPTVLSSPPPSPALRLYNVTFAVSSAGGPTLDGTVPYLETETLFFMSQAQNMTGFDVVASYQDQSNSPLTDPSVSFSFYPPEGTDGPFPLVLIVPASGWEGFVPAGNPVPENVTVNATSPEGAVGQATEGIVNETNGMGQWTVEVQVGAAAGGRVRSGSISFSIAIEILFLEIEATAIP